MSSRLARPSSGAVEGFVSPWLHTEACCDGCRSSPISGSRYKCQIRKDFDLCSKCVRQQSQDAQRHFFKIERCQASKPYQIRYIECRDCATVPIRGPRYRHKTQENVDLCEGCFKKATVAQNANQKLAYEKIELTKPRSHRKKHHDPALHFDKACDECRVCPVVGPCFTLVQNPNYDVCAHCHDDLLIQEKFKAGDFVAASHPRPSAAVHLDIMSCVSCGVFPICGPAYQHQRKELKIVCLLCYFQVKKQKKDRFTRVEPPRTISYFVSNTSSVPSHSAHLSRYKSDPGHKTTPPHEYIRTASSAPHSVRTNTNPGPPPPSSYQYPTQTIPTAQPPPSSYQYPTQTIPTAQPPPTRSYPYATQPQTHSYQYPAYPTSGTRPPPAASYQYPTQPSYPASYSSGSAQAYPSSYPPQNPGHYGAATGAAQSYPASTNSVDQQQEQMLAMIKYYQMQTELKQQEILALMQKQQNASQEAQSQYLSQFFQMLGTNGSGTGSNPMGAGGMDFSSLLGGNNVSVTGVDYSNSMGAGGVDFTSLDYSNLMGAGGADYSSFLGGYNGAGVDYSSLLGDNSSSGVDVASLLSGGGGDGVISTLIGAFTSLAFSS